jgi:hypothetical protein
MDSQKISEGIIIGAVGGTAVGMAVSFTRYAHQKIVERIEMRRVHSWLRRNTKDKDQERYRSTRTIASWNNLTEDRVRYICSLHREIYLSTGKAEDMWGVYGIAGREH